MEAASVVSLQFNKADLHVHSWYSDGSQTIPEILAHVATHTDLRVLAITDHDCIEGAFEARALAPRFGLEVIVGQEVSTDHGHVLALYVHKAIPAGLSIPETVRRIHAQGGLAVLAHPLDRLSNSPMRRLPRPSREDWAAYYADGLEALNACQLDPLASPRARVLGRALQVALTGGSDAHHLRSIGVAYTWFPGRTAEDLRRAILQRRCYPGGRCWNLADYWGWLASSWLPRTLHLRARPLSSVDLA